MTEQFTIQPEGAPKKRASSKRNMPTKTQLKEMIGGIIVMANMAVFANEKTRLWALTEQECEQEEDAIVDLIMAYPGLGRWFVKAQKTGPLLQFFIVQYLVFGKRISTYIGEQKAKEKQPVSEMAREHPNGASHIDPLDTLRAHSQTG